MAERNTTRFLVLPSAARTTTGVATLELNEFSEGYVALDVTAVSGTTPSMSVKVQVSDDNVTWYDEGTSFAAVTAISRPAVAKFTNFGRYVRLSYTITGTTPSFTFSAALVMK
jgi:hypothetical protein